MFWLQSGHDPTSVAVVAEDAAAVAGCGIAGAALMATQHFGSSVFDAAGSIAVGGLLGTTAMYLINSNRLLLLGRYVYFDYFWLFLVIFLVIFGYFGNLRMGNCTDVVFC